MEAPAEPDAAAGVEGDGVVFVLESTPLEAAKVGKAYAILNGDDHKGFLQRHKKDPAEYRPDILHQTLLAILDSPLNKAGRIKAVYVHTQKNVLFEVNVHTKLPRTFKRFCGLMVQLLQKLSIRATNGPDKLLKVIKGPVTKHLPVGAQRIGMSYSSPQVRDMHDLVRDLPAGTPAVFIVGAMAHGKADASYTDSWTSISQFPLSAACCVGRICNAFEQKWKIV